MKFGIQRKDNMLILNILFGIDDLDPSFGPIIEELNDFMKFALRIFTGICHKKINHV